MFKADPSLIHDLLLFSPRCVVLVNYFWAQFVMDHIHIRAQVSYLCKNGGFNLQLFNLDKPTGISYYNVPNRRIFLPVPQIWMKNRYSVSG